MAQTAPTAQPAPAAPQEAATQIEDVIVQARRAEERQQTVPLAISTVTDERLTQASATSIADIQRLVPALQITQGSTGQQDFTIRGSFGGFGVDPSVVTYIDDVPIDSRTLVYGLYDLGSVQQLKGPQGTLFGRNSTGGAVLFFSRRPSLDGVEGYLSARYGSYDQRRLEGAVNLPLSDTLALRLSGQIERRDGILESVTAPGLQYDNRDNDAIRASLLWQPTETIENLTQVTHYRVGEHRYPQVIVSLAGPCTGPTAPALSCLYQPPFNGLLGTGNIRAGFTQQQGLRPDQTVANDPTTDDVDRDSITNSFTVDLGGVSVRNILYYGDTFVGFSRDYDGTPAQVIDAFSTVDTQTFYTETQVFGSLFDDRLDWRIGGVYSVDDADYSQTTAIFPLPTSLLQPKTTRSVTEFESRALFGQATYDLSDLIHGVSITAGYRYTWDDRTIATTAFGGRTVRTCALQVLPVPVTGPSPFPNTDLATCTRKLDASFGDYNYNLTIDWKPTDRLLIYAAARRGYKTGSFNAFETDPRLAQYAPEVIEDIELGLKADWTLGSVPMRTNIAAFRAEYTDIQASITQISPTSGDVNVIVQNRDPITGASNLATIEGFEVELTALPTSWLEIAAFYSETKAVYDQYFNTSGRNLAGENVSGVVPQTYGVTLNAEIPVQGPFEGLDLSASYYESAAPQSNSTTTNFGSGRSAIDARATARNLFGTQADVSIFGKNLADEVRCTTNTLVVGALTVTCSQPRTYGVEVAYRF